MAVSVEKAIIEGRNLIMIFQQMDLSDALNPASDGYRIIPFTLKASRKYIEQCKDVADERVLAIIEALRTYIKKYEKGIQ